MTKLNDKMKVGGKEFVLVEILEEPNTGLLRVRADHGAYALVPVELWEAAAKGVELEAGIPLDRLICPVCQATGWMTSIVRERGSTAVMGPVDKYYDEEGKYHFHDPSYIRREYECSQNHRWDRIESATKCWCGWTAEEETED